LHFFISFTFSIAKQQQQNKTRQLISQTSQLKTSSIMKSLHFVSLLLFSLSTWQIPACLCLGTWTWMYGENTLNSNGYYGEKGVPNPSNIPRARAYATSSYDMISGTLWLFGGYSSGKLIAYNKD
jgi:hypothetical protein